MEASPEREEVAGSSPTLGDLFLSFLRLGATAFGGPAMVAYIGEVVVKRKKWLDQPAFRGGVVLAQSIFRRGGLIERTRRINDSLRQPRRNVLP